MKTVNIAVRVAVVGTVLLSIGCATSGNSPNLAARSGNTSIDHQKVAMVEHVARKRGVSVVWINPPEIPASRDNR